MRPSSFTKTATRVGSRSELLERQFSALCKIAHKLSWEKNIEDTLTGILSVLHNDGRLLHGLITLADPMHTVLHVGAVYSEDENLSKSTASVRYRAGEGVLGRILQHNQPIVLARISSEPRFLDRLSLYDLELPFYCHTDSRWRWRSHRGVGCAAGCICRRLPQRAHNIYGGSSQSAVADCASFSEYGKRPQYRQRAR